MSHVDLENLNHAELIAQYVLECRGYGHTLPYTDYDIIRGWLQAAGSSDTLLVILSEVLPQHFAPPGAQGTVTKANNRHSTLRPLERRVLRRIKSLQGIAGHGP